MASKASSKWICQTLGSAQSASRPSRRRQRRRKVQVRQKLSRRSPQRPRLTQYRRELRSHPEPTLTSKDIRFDTLLYILILLLTRSKTKKIGDFCVLRDKFSIFLYVSLKSKLKSLWSSLSSFLRIFETIFRYFLFCKSFSAAEINRLQICLFLRHLKSRRQKERFVRLLSAKCKNNYWLLLISGIKRY